MYIISMCSAKKPAHVIFIYYAIMTLTTGLGKGGVMNPLLACIIPNLICLGAGVFLLQKKNA